MTMTAPLETNVPADILLAVQGHGLAVANTCDLVRIPQVHEMYLDSFLFEPSIHRCDVYPAVLCGLSAATSHHT